MTDHPQYPTGRQITDADLLAALMPDTAAGAAPAAPAPAVPAVPAPQFDVAALLELARRQGALEAAVTHTATIKTPAPIVPRWAVGTAVASVGIGAGACLLGWALDLLATGAAAVAAGITAAAPMLLIGAVLVVALLARRKGGGIEVTQTITQTITQSVKGGGRR
ncbi:spdB1 [Streptomyces laurentii]|uniref:SpdB1 n=1 Tax=Streptomyces laurentii TaxID=39478 RepID=A0A160P1Y3_STRLU|nr:spdB1 [Streptomyces laurentii]